MIYNIEFKGIKLDVEANVSDPSIDGSDNGEIEIIDIFHDYESIFDIVECIKDYEELIINEVRKTL